MGLIDEVHALVDREVGIRVEAIRREFDGYIDPNIFATVRLSIPEAARLVSYDARTIRAYVNHGLIPLHPDSTDGKPLISAADVLRLPGRKLKHTRINQ
jgi:hypothetical protein